MDVLILLVVVGTTIWVGVDASNLQTRNGTRVGNLSTAAWVVLCILLWIIVFPVYLFSRSRYQARLAANPSAPPRAAGQQAAFAGPSEQIQPPGESSALPVDPSPSNSTAAELQRLVRLREAGDLTQDQFEKLRTRLLE